LALVHGFRTQSYWAESIPIDIVQRSIEHSLSFGVYRTAQQVGFVRVISDYATFAYVGDVFILDEHRGQGLSKWLMQVVTEHPDLQGLRMWLLATRDAHGLYAQSGFEPLSAPERFMVKRDPDVYKRG
ncbi:MAG: GNAT family N-acetyltransferase, partial [Chloroflexales bacterium]|nr:GNAT family N-acetyltransferase [Chloroflexales bacterium]